METAKERRFDLAGALFARDIEALPECSHETEDLYAAWRNALAARMNACTARANDENARILGSVYRAESQKKWGEDLVRAAPYALGYTGVAAYIIGYLYLAGLNSVYLPGMSLDYPYFQTVTSLITLGPLLLLLTYVFLPWLVATRPPYPEVFLRAISSTQRNMILASHYARLIDKLDDRARRGQCSDCLVRGDCDRGWMKQQRRHYSRRLTKILLKFHWSIARDSPVTVLASFALTDPSGWGIRIYQLLAIVPVLVALGLLFWVPTGSEFLYMLLTEVIFVACAAICVFVFGYARLAFREREHRGAATVCCILLAMFIFVAPLTYGRIGGYVSLLSEEHRPTMATVVLTDGTSVSGTLRSSRLSQDAFVTTGTPCLTRVPSASIRSMIVTAPTSILSN